MVDVSHLQTSLLEVFEIMQSRFEASLILAIVTVDHGIASWLGYKFATCTTLMAHMVIR